MKLKVWFAASALVASAALCLADEPKQQPSADQQKEMEAMMAAASPGAAHKKLDAMVGDWDANVMMWMAPGAPPQQSAGTSTARWILGNRYIEEHFSGNMMGMPFSGVGFTGYDNVKKTYVGTWMDSMSTSMMMSTGMQQSDNSWMFKGTMADPMTGKDSPFEEKVTVKDNDHHMFEMFAPGPDGKMFKMMEITYTRKK